MKVKADFITNSSSTCYVLSSIVSGMLPRLSGAYEMLKSHYPNQEFLYQGYAHINIDNSDVDIYESFGRPCISMDLQMNDSYYYDEEDNGRAVTFFQLKLDLHNPYEHDQVEIVKDVIENVLFKQLEENIKASQLTYLAFPSSIFGDGWDNGDPQGPSHKYTRKYELYKYETKMGILNIIDSKIISEITDISQPLSLNEIVLNSINDTGLILGGTK